MKKLLIFAVLIILTISNLKSQDLIDPPAIVTQGDTIIDFNNTAVFDKGWNDFLCGWNYGSLGKQFDELMNSNYYLHGWSTGQDLGWLNRGAGHRWYLTIYPLNQFSDVTVGVTQAIVFEPSIEVDKTDNFTPGPNNTEGAVFGFQNKQLGISSNNGISTIDTNINTSLPVLSNIWPKDELKFWDWITFSLIT